MRKNWNRVMGRHVFGLNRSSSFPEEQKEPVSQPDISSPLPAFGPRPPKTNQVRRKLGRNFARIKSYRPDGQPKMATFRSSGGQILSADILEIRSDNVAILRRGKSTFKRILIE